MLLRFTSVYFIFIHITCRSRRPGPGRPEIASRNASHAWAESVIVRAVTCPLRRQVASRLFVASLLLAGCSHVTRSRDAPAAPSAGSLRLDGVVRGCSQVFGADCEWVLYNHIAQWWVSVSFCRARWPSATATDTTVRHGLSSVHWRSFAAESRKLTLIFVSETGWRKGGQGFRQGKGEGGLAFGQGRPTGKP